MGSGINDQSVSKRKKGIPKFVNIYKILEMMIAECLNQLLLQNTMHK